MKSSTGKGFNPLSLGEGWGEVTHNPCISNTYEAIALAGEKNIPSC